MKKCFKCGEVKPLSEFYSHPRMADGHLNKCKTCTKRDVKGNREDKVDYYIEYDRGRERRGSAEDTRKYREENPRKYEAHKIVGNALRVGLLTKQPCEVCGGEERVNAHHDDYSKPLTIRWLCSKHHHEWHKINGEALNG